MEGVYRVHAALLHWVRVKNLKINLNEPDQIVYFELTCSSIRIFLVYSHATLNTPDPVDLGS